MLKFVIFTCAFVVCLAIPKQQAPPSPQPLSTPAPRVTCGETPVNMFECLGKPELIKREVFMKCKGSLSPCDKMKCLFRKAGWALAGDKVNKQNVSEHLDTFAMDQPAWSAVVQRAKADCLGRDLPPQSTELDCPAQDVMHCILMSFFRNATPSQWLATPECAYPKSFAAACPICPSDCFAPQIPIGSCNACLSLPRTS